MSRSECRLISPVAQDQWALVRNNSNKAQECSKCRLSKDSSNNKVAFKMPRLANIKSPRNKCLHKANISKALKVTCSNKCLKVSSNNKVGSSSKAHKVNNLLVASSNKVHKVNSTNKCLLRANISKALKVICNNKVQECNKCHLNKDSSNNNKAVNSRNKVRLGTNSDTRHNNRCLASLPKDSSNSKVLRAVSSNNLLKVVKCNRCHKTPLCAS